MCRVCLQFFLSLNILWWRWRNVCLGLCWSVGNLVDLKERCLNQWPDFLQLNMFLLSVSHFFNDILGPNCSYSNCLKTVKLEEQPSLKGVSSSIIYLSFSMPGEDTAGGWLFGLNGCFCTFKYEHECDAVGFWLSAEWKKMFIPASLFCQCNCQHMNGCMNESIVENFNLTEWETRSHEST